jgi:hypothetical protein
MYNNNNNHWRMYLGTIDIKLLGSLIWTVARLRRMIWQNRLIFEAVAVAERIFSSWCKATGLNKVAADLIWSTIVNNSLTIPYL